ncbi:MAG: hypothetical protein KA035_01715 [Candidatus Levybacteria bacterium]|nr:hypothetical protein [Candidatus Levybacteria bacterium]
MRETRRFSIEPYVNQGGILGSELQINPRAVGSVMTRGAFYRDIYVSRGSEDKDGAMPQGQHELALLKFKIPTFSSTDAKSRRSSLRRRNDGWFVDIHDQEIHQDVDQKMSKDFKATPGGTSGTEEFKGRYVSTMNDEIQKRLAQVFHNEKKQRLVVTSLHSGLLDGTLALSSAGLYFGGKMVIGEMIEGFKQPEMSTVDLIRIFAGAFAFRFGAISAVGGIVDAKVAHDKINSKTNLELRGWESFFPNFQVRNLVQGEIALIRSGNKTVELRPQE